jgi:integrase/recombinase XerD
MEQFIKKPHIILRLRRGPLGPYLDLYAKHLEEQGYASTAACLLIRVVGGFSRWLKRNEVSVTSITREVILKYLKCRARSHRPTRSDATALKKMLNILYEQGVIKRPSVVQAPANHFALEFASYLRDERGLSKSTIRRYTDVVSSFLNQQYLEGPVNLSVLSAKDVIFFVTSEARRIGTRSSRNVTNGLRSFLQYAEYQGHTSAALANSVPTVANWSDTDIPRALPAEQIEKILNRCNRDTAIGSRDYAILQLLARLGLRACEVAGLKLQDIDWTLSAIVVRGKGGKKKQLPLPAEVGKAIAEYLQKWRVQSPDRSVFLRHRAPIVGFSHPGAIGSIVGRAIARAKIDSTRKGSHQFRHGLATEMLRKGSSLADIGEILGHASPRTTQIYAKVDIESLRRLAISWPGGAK